MATKHVSWHKACQIDDIEEEDVIDVKIDGKTYALYFTLGNYYATDGLCSHEQACLADGLVTGDTIECPKHNARFHIPSGKATRRPARTDLTTYPVKVEEQAIFIGFTSEE
ncbi:MAG: non-heme iron oxygenase ferredoxin subunit [bacterium]|nr:non-heme iron oxygenase ferredoxin subunit [bacterium]